MVVSESESEFLSESEPEPMSEHQAAIDGTQDNLPISQAHEGEVDCKPESIEKQEDINQKAVSTDIAEPKDLTENQTDISSPTREDNQEDSNNPKSEERLLLSIDDDPDITEAKDIQNTKTNIDSSKSDDNREEPQENQTEISSPTSEEGLSLFIDLQENKIDKEDNPEEPLEIQTEIISPAKEDTTRPLVLEERHSLSIAETKKRRASVYSNELLFIPKELARSELQQRTRSLSRYAKNREYHLRMLKFPVGSGRPRYVAKQMKKVREDYQPTLNQPHNESETNDCQADIKVEEFMDDPSEECQNPKELPLNMPDLGAESEEVKNQLPDDEEISIILFDLVKKEVDPNDPLEEENRRILQSQRESVIKTSKRRHYPYLCWHSPDQEVLDFKMELTKPEIQVGFCEANNEEVEELALPDPEIEQPPEVENHQEEPSVIINYPEPQNQLTNETPTEEPVEEDVPAHNFTPEDPSQSTSSVLRQQLMHHIVQPNLCSQELCQSIQSNNNAVDRVNQNLRQQQFIEPSQEQSLQWNPQTNQTFHKQQLHLQQQYMQQQLHHPSSSSQQQQEVIYQQHRHEAEDKLQQMRVMYQRIKCREEDQLHQLGRSLKKLLDERHTCERQHAEEKRLFLAKMEQLKKLEEKLKADREQLQRQLRSDLRTLELRIADQQALAWSWQQQQQQLLVQQQSQQQQQQQQHFMHHHPHSQEPHHHPNQEPYMQPSFLYDPPAYVYPTMPAYHQESMVFQQRIQAYHDQQDQNYNATELQRRLHLPPPSAYCQSNRTSTEVSPNSRKVRHRRVNADPYPLAQLRAMTLPPAAEIMQLQRNPQMSQHPHPPAAQSQSQAHQPRNEHFGITSVMTNYVASFMNMRAER
ncbi:interaptin [Drosophila takahashii]|uniref:interaptin n=1 Tax=Drosophila takahashii TaxID=29030 RepID=UPI001CF8540D|nr:RNA polymerase II degradation factor 1 [Drosophila takahashii]